MRRHQSEHLFLQQLMPMATEETPSDKKIIEKSAFFKGGRTSKTAVGKAQRMTSSTPADMIVYSPSAILAGFHTMPRLLASLVITLALTMPTTAVAGTSNSLLDVTPDGKLLVVANTDADSVSVVDAKGRKLLHEIPVGDHPEGVAWIGNGPLVVVTLWGEDKLAFVNADTEKVAFALNVDDEPYGVVVTKDGKLAYVTHDYPGTVSEIDLEARKVLRTFKAGDCVRGIALSNDEKTLYVTEFFTAKLIALDIASGKITDSWLGGETENLCRQVALHPKWQKAYLPHIRSRVSTIDARGSIFGHLSICDLAPPKDADEKRRRGHAVDAFNALQVAANPWEVAVSPDGSRVYIIYAGTDDLNYFQALDDSYKDVKTLGFPQIGKHPRAIRVSPDSSELYIYNTLDCEVAVYDPNVRKLGAVKVCTPPKTAEWRRGKELFVSARQPMGSAKWISCSSCHPDGITDARVWQNPEGNRRTPHMFGLAHTHPLHWSADRDEVQDFEYTIRSKLMGGRGLFKGELEARKGLRPPRWTCTFRASPPISTRLPCTPTRSSRGPRRTHRMASSRRKPSAAASSSSRPRRSARRATAGRTSPIVR